MPVPTAPTLEIQGSEFPVARVYCISNAIPQTMKIEVGAVGVCGTCVFERRGSGASTILKPPQNNVGAVEPQRGCDDGGTAGIDVG